MIQTVNLHDFRQAFHDHDRSNQFTPEALGCIFDYFEQLEQDTEIPYELDVIALCCDISESTPEEIQRQYGIDHDCEDEGDLERKVMDYLDDHTSVIGQTDGNIVFFQF